eukprot:6194887-Pleurochrysis_carterae.AAC.6
MQRAQLSPFAIQLLRRSVQCGGAGDLQVLHEPDLLAKGAERLRLLWRRVQLLHRHLHGRRAPRLVLDAALVPRAAKHVGEASRANLKQARPRVNRRVGARAGTIAAWTQGCNARSDIVIDAG